MWMVQYGPRPIARLTPSGYFGKLTVEAVESPAGLRFRGLIPGKRKYWWQFWRA